MYEGWERDAEAARKAFQWRGGAVRLIEEITDPIVRGMEWGRVEKDTFTVPYWPGAKEGDVAAGPWVWRYGTASAGTGSSYRVLATKVHADVAAREGGPVILTVLSPWQDSWAFADGGYIDESYVAEHLTGHRWMDGRLHGGDLAALTMTIRVLLGRTEHDPILSALNDRTEA